MTMITSVYLSALTLFLVGSAYAQAQTAPQWGQCGGTGWTGPTACPVGWVCTPVSPPWYSQCLQGTATTTATTTSSTSPVGGSGTGSSASSSTATTTAAGGSATLAPGWSFVRAVEDPNFHKYLMSEVLGTPSAGVLGDYTNAAQFQVTDGQLIQNAGGTNLYAVVQPPANSTVKMLGITWSTTPDTLGSFVFSGDSLEWSSPSVPRQQTNAWLVCPSDNILFVYINLGAYDFMTPTGCADETLNAYTGATAVP